MSCGQPIPDGDSVLHCVHHRHWDFDNGLPEDQGFLFDTRDHAVSSYWAECPLGKIVPEEVRALHSPPPERPEDRGVVRLPASLIRTDGFLHLEHTPCSPGCLHVSHSSITVTAAVGRPTKEQRHRAYQILVKASRREIPPVRP
jgi:hypothetical protein